MPPTENPISDDEFEASHDLMLDAITKHFADTGGTGKAVTLSSRDNKDDSVMVFAISCPHEHSDMMFEVLKNMAATVDKSMNKVFEHDS